MAICIIKPICIRDIIGMISCIPLASYKIKGGDLDDLYSAPILRRYSFISARIIVRLFTDLLRNNPDELRDLDYHAKSNLEHFIGTVQNYENDRDVHELLEMLNSENLSFESLIENTID